MEKKEIGRTYYYENFITDEQQKYLSDWIVENIKYMRLAVPVNGEKDQMEGVYRHFVKLSALPSVPELVYELKNKIIELENIDPIILDPINEDWIGITRENAYVEPHKDHNGFDKLYYTRRYNILVSLPEQGGEPIYGQDVLELPEKSIWRCDAGLVVHSSVPNKGTKPRINLSFGFLIPISEKKSRTLI